MRAIFDFFRDLKDGTAHYLGPFVLLAGLLGGLAYSIGRHA